MGIGNLGITLKRRRATRFNWHGGYFPVCFTCSQRGDAFLEGG